ncbi:hypothetical protein HRR75_004990 [Exophiala dermatitidis]|nr:hypothetical protein HRR75_004990 [Exophiala dermatitidis]
MKPASAIKHSVVLLASLATFSTALPGPGQWQEPNGAPAGVSQGAGHTGIQQGVGAAKVEPHPSATPSAIYKGASSAQHKAEGSSGTHEAQHKNAGGSPNGHAAFPPGNSAEHKWQGGSTSQSHPRDLEHGEHHAAPAHAETADDAVADIRFPHLKPTHESGDLHTHEARGTVRGMYECMNKNFVMPCTYTPVTSGQCYNANYGNQGSMGPDKGLSCTLYERPDCNKINSGWGHAGGFEWPGIKNYQISYLLTLAGFPDTGPKSYRCTFTSEKKGG